MSYIAGGKYCGKKIKSVDSLRPTMAKVRNAIFNILHSKFNLHNGFVMADLFCGIGSVSLEAISRGANHVFMVDNNNEHLRVASENIAQIDSLNKATIINTNIIERMPKINTRCDFVFIDPPYGNNFMDLLFKKLIDCCFFDDESIIIVELSKKEVYKLPDSYHVIDNRWYGNAQIVMLKISKKGTCNV